MAAYIRERRGVKQFWDEVYEYIEKAYDTDALKIININGDGASWIKSGAKYIKQAKFVLDKYHMHKYIVVATAHLKDSKEDARAEIYRAIHKKKKYMAEEVIYSASEMIAAENKNRKRLGTLADVPIYSIPYPQIKKIAALKNHIWGL